MSFRTVIGTTTRGRRNGRHRMLGGCVLQPITVAGGPTVCRRVPIGVWCRTLPLGKHIHQQRSTSRTQRNSDRSVPQEEAEVKKTQKNFGRARSTSY